MQNMIDPSSGSREFREGLFDVVSFAKQTKMGTTISFFGHTQDADGPQVTNMTKPNELPAGESQQVYALRIGFNNVAAADLAAIRKNYRAQVIVAGKAVKTGPTEAFPFGGTIDSSQQVTFDPDDLVVLIQEGVRFRVELQSNAEYTLTDATDGVDIVVMLDGVHAVPVN